MTSRSTHALLLVGAPSDLAALDALARCLPGASELPWTELTSPARPGEAALTSPALTPEVARRLRELGAPVARVTRSSRGLAVAPLDAENSPPARWPEVASREAAGLLEALRPRAMARDAAADEAIFWAPAEHPGARRLVERLLALGRDDVAAHTLEREGARWIALRVPRPPTYLLLRARDRPDEGVAAFARHGDSGLWVRWGYAHPLAEVASIWLRRVDLDALVDLDGTWLTLPSAPPSRSLYDLLAPRFEARRADFTASREAPRFVVSLRLEPAAPREAEAWVLDPEQLLRLEGLVESLAEHELRRFTLARLEGAEGTRYLLRELQRPGHAPLAPRVSAAVDAPGFARAPGVEGLYVRAGMSLAPALRADSLRALLELDAARATLIDHDRDGPRIIAVHGDAEWSLSEWVELVATDRRADLDRLAETSVFEWLPPHSVAAPPPLPARPDAPPAPRPPTPREDRAEAPPDRDETPSPAGDSRAHGDDDGRGAELAARELERVRGPRDDAAAWRTLGELKLLVGERDDAGACLEAAIFYGGLRDDAARSLVAARAPEREARGLEALAQHDAPSSVDLAELGARALARLADPSAAPLDDATLLAVARRFADPEAPVSRWLAWSVLRAAHAARGDRLELTRAKERCLGALNERGLREEVDLPRFARGALSSGGGRESGEHLRALEAAWAVVAPSSGPLGAYAAAIFAVGFTRLAAPVRARDLAARVADESPRLAPANRALLDLYRAYALHGADADRWRVEVTSALDALRADARARDRVEHLRKRSEWLGATGTSVAPPRLRPALARALSELDADPASAAEVVAAAMDHAGHYDFEVVAAVERALAAALRAGDDVTLRAALDAVSLRVERRLRVAGPRARALGACLRAAAALGDLAAVESLVAKVSALVDGPGAHVHELLDAVAPALAALRRLGGGARGARFFEALAQAAARGERGATRLRAAAADGLLQLGARECAEAEVLRCVDEALASEMEPTERYQSARDALRVLRHFPVETRARCCARVAAGLERFTDTFTASQAGLYETHKVLILERLVDALADEVTLDGDALRALLDDEELAVRRRIRADWTEACGP